ncbi:hypothetical protein B0H14DRAFT_2632458 [Mycena olivaceomarginata]|nr:hypothetical protein B0H14DRAFT_2632458 [Mycena olivaceomarginata]
MDLLSLVRQCPPPKSDTENPGSASLPLSPMLATSIADESGSHQILMLDEIVVEQRAGWDYKTNMTLGACREHTGRNIPLDIWEMQRCSLRSSRAAVVEGSGNGRSSTLVALFRFTSRKGN